MSSAKNSASPVQSPGLATPPRRPRQFVFRLSLILLNLACLPTCVRTIPGICHKDSHCASGTCDKNWGVCEIQCTRDKDCPNEGTKYTRTCNTAIGWCAVA